MTKMSAKARIFQLTCRSRLLSSSSSQPPKLLLNLAHNRYASQSSFGGSGPKSSTTPPPRKAITITSDDGRHAWSELSAHEKASRATQQTFNVALAAAGLAGTIIVAYLLYVELFAADSKTRQFNHAVDRVKADQRCVELLGRPAKQIKAYGEPTSNKWARARPLAHTVEVDRGGTTHFRMHFHVEGTERKGVVNVHMTKGREDRGLVYMLLSLNVKGHPVVYLENRTAQQNVKEKVGKMFGVQWR